MAYTIEEYNSLKSAIALGATKVKYADKEVEYRSLTDMRAILILMEGDIFPSKTTNRKKFISYGRGYENTSELDR